MSNASLQLGGDNWAAKDGNLLGYQRSSSSSVHIPHEFTFTRGSNLAATRVAANGLIEKGRENFLLQSNNFDTTPWTTDGASVTSGQSGYDGSNDAWKLSGTGGSFPRVQQNKSVSGVATYSVYAKSGNVNVLRLLTISGSNTDVRFQLTESGSILTQTGSERIESKITRLGSTDWYKCSITFNGSSTNFRIYPMSDNLTFAVNGEFIYIQDAQLEQGLVATDYIETGASTVQAGLLEDEPRIDYTGGTGSLLLEPNRTNLVKHSEYIDTTWVGYRAISTQNVTQSPSGTNDAALIYEDSVNNSHYLLTNVTTSSSTTYTQSAFVKKKDSGIYASLRTNGVGGDSYIIFDFDTATIVDEGSDIISSGVVDYSNGWYRIYMTYTLASSGFLAGITNSTTNPISNHLGTGKGYHLWGAQLEEGSYKTSYIPNHSGGSVTRSADFCSGAGDASTFNDAEGVLYAEISALADDLTFRTIIINDGSNANRVLIRYRTTSNVINFLLTASSSTIKNVTFPVTDITDVHKIAIAYKSGDIRLYIDGVQVGSFTNAFTLSSLNNLSFMNYNGDDPFYGNVKQVLYFPTALSDAQCSALTVEGLKEEILTSYIAAVDTLEDGAEARLDTYLQNLEDLIV